MTKAIFQLQNQDVYSAGQGQSFVLGVGSCDSWRKLYADFDVSFRLISFV